MKLGELKWPDIRDMDKSKVVVVPTAAMEQHGPHMPLLTDTILTQGVVDAVEQEMGDEILTLPVLWLGSSHHHLDFPGTVSVDSDLYNQVICQICDCLIQAGFRKIFMLNGHGGNIAPGGAALTKTRLKHRDMDPLFLVSGPYWSVAAEEFAAIPEIESPALNHACEYEGSMCMFLRPDLVDLDKAVGYRATVHSDFVDPHAWHSGKGVSLAVSFKDLSDNGAMGRGDLATPEKGRKLIRAAGKAVSAFLRDMGAWEKIERTPKPPIP